MHNLDEKTFDMQAKFIQPWIKSDVDFGEQQQMIHELLKKKCHANIEKNVFIAPNANVFAHSLVILDGSYIASYAVVRGNIRIGKNTSINTNVHMAGKITIGNNCRIAAFVSMYGFNHGFDRIDIPTRSQSDTVKGINLGDDVWVGANAIILDGVSIGSHCIVAAGAVVTKSFGDFAIIAGNPAKKIKDRRKDGDKIVTIEYAKQSDSFHYAIDTPNHTYKDKNYDFGLKGWFATSDSADMLLLKYDNGEKLILDLDKERPDVHRHLKQLNKINFLKSDMRYGFSLSLKDINSTLYCYSNNALKPICYINFSDWKNEEKLPRIE